MLFVFTFFMLVFLPGILIPALFGPRAVSVTYFFMKAWSWVFSKLTFISYKMVGREKINRQKSYIYISNHTSSLDLPGIAMTIKGQFRPLAKKELLKVPVWGWVTRATDFGRFTRVEGKSHYSHGTRDHFSFLAFNQDSSFS